MVFSVFSCQFSENNIAGGYGSLLPKLVNFYLALKIFLAIADYNAFVCFVDLLAVDVEDTVVDGEGLVKSYIVDSGC